MQLRYYEIIEQSENRTHLKTSSSPLFYSRDGINYFEITEDVRTEVEQVMRNNLYNSHSKLNGEIVLYTDDLSNIKVKSRNPWIENAEFDNNIKYPRELLYIEGAENIPGEIILPCDDYDRVYIINDDDTIEFIDPYNEINNFERPYYIKADGKTTIYVNHFSGGSGTQSDPYTIETPSEFETLLGGYYNTAYYKLANDLDFTDYNFTVDYIGYKFAGEIDGDGHKISNFYWLVDSNDYTPFYYDFSGTMKNIYWDNFEIDGKTNNEQYVGLFDKLADNWGSEPTSTLENCIFKGKISGYRYCGLAGEITAANISNTIFMLDIEITDRFGGTLFGAGQNTTNLNISNSYMVSNTFGSSSQFNDTIASSLDSAPNPTININNFYINGETDSFYYNYENLSLSTTAEMKTQSHYTDFDFTNVWAIDPAVNDGYPIQQIFASTGEGSETASGGSETTILIAIEQAGYKSISGSSEVILDILVEGLGKEVVESYSSGSETSILISSEQAGFKQARAPPAETTVNVNTEQEGSKTAKGQNETSLEIAQEATGGKNTAGSAQSSINISTEHEGAKSAYFGSETAIEVDVENAGRKNTSGNAETSLEISTEQEGKKNPKGSSETNIEISVEGSGVIETEFKSGGSEVGLNIAQEATGQKNTSGFAESYVDISLEGKGFKWVGFGVYTAIDIFIEQEGFKNSFNGSEQAVVIDVEGAGGMSSVDGAGGSSAKIEIEPNGSGSKATAGGQEIPVEIQPTATGIKKRSGGSETGITIDEESSGYKNINADLSAKLEISTEQEGIKTTKDYSEATIEIILEAEAIKTITGGSETGIFVDAFGFGASGDFGIGRIELTSYLGKTNKSKLEVIHNNIQLLADVNKINLLVIRNNIQLSTEGVNKVVIIRW